MLKSDLSVGVPFAGTIRVQSDRGGVEEREGESSAERKERVANRPTDRMSV